MPTRGGIGQEGFDLVELRTAEGHALYLKGRISGHIFRFSLARDPAQARLWCLFVERCAAVGTIGQRLDGVIGPGRLTREEALTALQELAADPTKWLGQRRRQPLLAWLRASGAKSENPLPEAKR